MIEIEHHPLQPFLPEHAKVLLLGSFPPPRLRWKMDFYYPNFQNDMWRIMGLIFFQDKNYFIDLQNRTFKTIVIQQFLQTKGIAIYDSAIAVKRLKGNAADSHLEIVEYADLQKILAQLKQCHHIITTGEKAAQTMMLALGESLQAPTIGQSQHIHLGERTIYLHRLPSSSRAYPMKLEQKAQHYAALFDQIGLI
ncbi:uracil-DNA glycosylase family protein [Acinetobacter qingfengensis]|uniref:DNA glycosylase n=1 Tax=Acinetobacter qingfengensis TaxID=1262585 RepID=A0A1E7R1S3_9GAMM|nr:uracil-DNA glycosylase family protein [Acinetobacter qingfengensis]KAA8735578.1 uracil-DNA glycosylase family protein [Acinetobacter qingfengensis]OEY93256.1 DNA glycosylase [Acinetobacter qingfengensis]